MFVERKGFNDFMLHRDNWCELNVWTEFKKLRATLYKGIGLPAWCLLSDGVRTGHVSLQICKWCLRCYPSKSYLKAATMASFKVKKTSHCKFSLTLTSKGSHSILYAAAVNKHCFQVCFCLPLQICHLAQGAEPWPLAWRCRPSLGWD